MHLRTVALVGTIWLVSMAAAVTWAQSSGNTQRLPVVIEGQADGDVISGENIGFQPVFDPSAPLGKVTGKLVVKVDGEWRDANFVVTTVRTVK